MQAVRKNRCVPMHRALNGIWLCSMYSGIAVTVVVRSGGRGNRFTCVFLGGMVWLRYVLPYLGMSF